MTGEVSSLEHEIGDDTVEAAASVSLFTSQSLCCAQGPYKSVLASTQFTEVPGCLGDDIVVQFATSPSALVRNGVRAELAAHRQTQHVA